MRSLVCALTVALTVGPVLPGGSVRAQPVDTTGISPDPLFTSRDAVFTGVVVLGTLAIAPLDKQFANYMQGQPQKNRFLRTLARTVEDIAVPGAFIIGASLYSVGRVGGYERMADLGLHGTEAILAGTVLTHGIKIIAGRARPYVGEDKPLGFGFGRGLRQEDYRSFPSGHTLIGFAAAAAFTEEARKWDADSFWYVAPVMYGGATLIGLSRVYDNKHWMSDVIVGGFIGTFSGLKVVKYHHTRPNNKIDRILLGVSMVPVGTAGYAPTLMMGRR